MFTNAETYLSTLKDYDRAFSAYQSITQRKTNDYRSWWGTLRAASHDFTLIYVAKQDYEKMCYYADNTLQLAPDNEKTTLKNQWEEYIASKDQEFAERVERMKARQKKMNRNRILSRSIINGVSIVIHLFIILFGLFHFDSFSLEQATPVFVYVGVSLVVNAIVTIIFQLVCHAPETCIYQIITTIAVAVYSSYRLTTGNLYVATLLELLMIAAFEIIIVAICIFPTAIISKRILRNKRNA